MTAPVLVVLLRIADLRGGPLVANAPVSEAEAQKWGEERGAAAVFYWPPTKTAYITATKPHPASLELDEAERKDGH